MSNEQYGETGGWGLPSDHTGAFEDRLAELDLAQMLAAANARRRAKGLAELSPAAYRAQLERDRR